MKRYNVYFSFNDEIELRVVIDTLFDWETQRNEIITQAREKLIQYNLESMSNLKCVEVSFLEDT